VIYESQYALRLYSWAQKYLTAGSKRISLEQLRKVLGLESVKDADGKIIQEAPLPVWANLRQRALDTAIAEINKKTDLNIALEALDRSKHRRVTALTFVGDLLSNLFVDALSNRDHSASAGSMGSSAHQWEKHSQQICGLAV
jgi:plasmid replication initiation protein